MLTVSRNFAFSDLPDLHLQQHLRSSNYKPLQRRKALIYNIVASLMLSQKLYLYVHDWITQFVERESAVDFSW